MRIRPKAVSHWLTPVWFLGFAQNYPKPFEQLNKAPVEETLHACMHPGSGSCTIGAGQFFMSEMPNALRVYVPLNIIMALAFRRSQMVSKYVPWEPCAAKRTRFRDQRDRERDRNWDQEGNERHLSAQSRLLSITDPTRRLNRAPFPPNPPKGPSRTPGSN